MNSKLRYFLLQLKSFSRYIPTFAVILVSAALILSIAFAGFSKITDNDNGKFCIGLIGETEGSYLGIGINTILSIDSTRFAMDFIKLDNEDQAVKMLENGKIEAYVIVPDDFVVSLANGEMKKLKYVDSTGSVGIISIFKNEVINVINEILDQSQKGIYGSHRLLRTYIKGSNVSWADEIALEYINLILNRTEAYDVTTVSAGGDLSFGAYMFCGIAVFVISLWGIAFCPLLIKKDYGLCKLLSRKNAGATAQVFGEYFAFFIFSAVFAVVLLSAVLVFSKGNLDFIPESSGDLLHTAAKFAGLLVPVIAVISSFQYFLYQISDGIIEGVLMQFITFSALSYISGCLYPISFFPDILKNISVFLPTGAAREILSFAFADSLSPLSPIIAGAWFIIFMSASVFIRSKAIDGRLDR